MSNILGFERQLDHINTSAELDGTFLPGGAFVNGNPFVPGTSGKVLPMDPSSMVNYYPPFTQNGLQISGQAVPVHNDVLPPRPQTMTSKPVPVLPYPVQQFMR